MSDWLSYQLLQEREMWEKDEAAQKEYQSWLMSLNSTALMEIRSPESEGKSSREQLSKSEGLTKKERNGPATFCGPVSPF